MMKLVLMFGVVLALFAGQVRAAELIYQTQTQYQQISITQSGEIRCMHFDNPEAWVKHFQSCVNLQNPAMMALDYTKLLMASLFLKKDPKRILIIGLGGGVLPNLFSNLSPDAYIETVEIDPGVVDIAKRFFFFTEHENKKVYVADGRVFVRQALKEGIKYDLVILDAFNGEYIPEHLMTQDFLKEVQALLTKGGVVAANTFSRSKLYDHESATYHSVFGDFRNMRVRRGNRIILATRHSSEMPGVAEIQNNARYYYPVFSDVYKVNVNRLLPLMSDVKDWNLDARVMTDQYAPANLLQDAKNDSAISRIFYTISDFTRANPLGAIGFFVVILLLITFVASKIVLIINKNKNIKA